MYPAGTLLATSVRLMLAAIVPCRFTAAAAPVVVYLTMVFRESPAGLQASAVWKQVKGQPVSTERKQMNGAKTVTFTSSNKLKPGLYKVVGYWGGNVACERQFEIIGAGPVKKGKKG